jgi:hypothetical protein
LALTFIDRATSIDLSVVCIVPANNRFWMVHNHHRAPDHLQQTVMTMMMVRNAEHQPLLSALPIELMFEIFSYLPWRI